MENTQFALNNKHFLRFLITIFIALFAYQVMILLSDNVVISLIITMIICIPFLLNFLNVNTVTHFDTNEKLVKLNYNLLGLKIPFKKLAYSEISKTLIKKESRSSYRYGQHRYSKYKLFIKDQNNKNYLIYGPISDNTKIKKVNKKLADCLKLESTNTVKKKRMKTLF